MSTVVHLGRAGGAAVADWRYCAEGWRATSACACGGGAAGWARREHGGHLLEARVRPTCEVVLTESPGAFAEGDGSGVGGCADSGLGVAVGGAPVDCVRRTFERPADRRKRQVGSVLPSSTNSCFMTWSRSG